MNGFNVYGFIIMECKWCDIKKYLKFLVLKKSIQVSFIDLQMDNLCQNMLNYLKDDEEN